MAIEIDQSGKVEDTAKNTVIAYSNGSKRAVWISKKTKRQVQELFRVNGIPRMFLCFLFSYGIFNLIKEFKTDQKITIDIEYPGKDKIISAIIYYFLNYYKKPKHSIKFARIGNKPRAHYSAKDVYDQKVKPDLIISFPDVFGALKIADGHLRGCISTLVDARPRLTKNHYSIKNEKVKKK